MKIMISACLAGENCKYEWNRGRFPGPLLGRGTGDGSSVRSWGVEQGTVPRFALGAWNRGRFPGPFWGMPS